MLCLLFVLGLVAGLVLGLVLGLVGGEWRIRRCSFASVGVLGDVLVVDCG